MIAVMSAIEQCLAQAGLPRRDLGQITACLALAGASEPTQLALARRQKYPFAQTVLVTDAQAACIGAHRGGDGGVIIVGTGTIGWGELNGPSSRSVGNLPVSDEGSGAWLGCSLRRVLWAHDGRVPDQLSMTCSITFGEATPSCVGPHGLCRAITAPLAPLVVSHAKRDNRDRAMRRAAAHIDALAARLLPQMCVRSLVGGLADMAQWVAADTRMHLTNRWAMPDGANACGRCSRASSLGCDNGRTRCSALTQMASELRGSRALRRQADAHRATGGAGRMVAAQPRSGRDLCARKLRHAAAFAKHLFERHLKSGRRRPQCGHNLPAAPAAEEPIAAHHLAIGRSDDLTEFALMAKPPAR
jgi:glucosamine kinase